MRRISSCGTSWRKPTFERRVPLLPDPQIFDETPVFAVARDPQGARHQLSDDRGDMVAMFFLVHAVLRLRFGRDVIDHGAGRIELFGVIDRHAELLLDAGKEFVECPAHPTYSSGSAPPRVEAKGSRTGWNISVHDVRRAQPNEEPILQPG